MSAPNEVSATQTDDDPPLTLYLERTNYSSMVEHLGGPVVKLTKRGYQDLEDAEAESALFEKMYEQLEESGIQRPLYLCVDCTELDGLSRAARKQMAKESKESGAYFASIACYGLGPFVSSVVHLFRLLRWQIGIHLFHDEEQSLAFLLEQMAAAENKGRASTGIFDQRERHPVEEDASTEAPSAPLGGPTLTGDTIRFLNRHLPQAETIRIAGFEQRVMQPPTWVYISPGNRFRFQAVLVGDDTVLSTIRGNLEEADVEALHEHWTEIFASLPGIHFHLIHDCLGLQSVSLAARRKMLAWKNSFEVEVRFQAVVGDETTEMLLSWARSLAPELLSAMTLKSSGDEAFDALRLFRSMRPGTARRITRQLGGAEVTTIELAGETVEVFAPEHWQLSTEDGQTRTKYSLLGHSTILAECSGKRTAEHTREIIALLDSIVLELGSERLHIIQLDRDISGVDSEVRRLRIAHFRATRDTWLSVCHVGTPGTRAVLTLLEPIISAVGHQVHPAASLTEAWARIQQQSAGQETEHPPGNDFSSLDPAKLPLVLKSQQQRLREYDDASRVLLEGMTRLTFADDDAWQPESLSPNAPFAPLFSALHLLERDFREIMTERDRRENQLAMAQIEAEAANTVKTQFLATMSHELRTPLTPIFGLIERLQGTNLDSEQLRAVDGIERAATGLLHQVSDLLDFATIGAGKLSLNPRPCDLRMLILSTIELHSEAARAKSLKITLAGEEKLPPLILVDPGRFQQVLDNLVSNAIKFTEEGDVDIRITCEELAEDAPTIRLRVDVSDTGPGIPTEEARTIFSRFNRGQAAEESVLPGVGLGLAIANNLIRYMGGMIGLETNDSVGATFWFELSLPILELDEATASADSAPTISPDGPTSPLNGARVLVVEDNDDIRELTSSSLQGAGCRTLLARNGSEALDLLTNDAVDLILMDCKMPVMDGYETTEELRRLDGEQSSTPVVALTAYALGEERERCFASGMNDYLTKPFSRIQLLEVVARNLPEERM